MNEKAAACFERGVAAHRRGELFPALGAFAQACALEPAQAAFWNARAAVLMELGRGDEAEAVLAAAIAAAGSDLSIRANQAILLDRLGRHQEAIAAAEAVLAVQPDHAAVRSTLALALLAVGRQDEAVIQCRQLTIARPDCPEGFLNLGEVLMAADRYEEALMAYGQALALAPRSTAATVGKGLALAMLERFSEADAVFAAAQREDPGETQACFRRMAAASGQRIPAAWRPKAVEVFLSRTWAQQQLCDWRRRDAYLAMLGCYAQQLSVADGVAYDCSLAFQTLAAPLAAPQRRALLDAVASGVSASVAAPVRRRHARPEGPLRLGFLSANFREHPSAQLHWRHFALYDRSRFRIHAYSLVAQEASPLRGRVAASVDCFRDLSGATVEEAAWRIGRDGVDILVDLTGYMDHARPEILAARPAPLQVSYHGSALSLGRRLVDYRITDRVTTPDDGEFSEALARVPDVHYMYNDEEPIAAAEPSRAECGLPEHGFVFCAFNSGFKVEPMVFGVWMDLLQCVPGSVLWLRDEGPVAAGNLRREAVARGVAGERLVFAPWQVRPVHLARHACADLFLDTFFCNAHTTAADALWAGLPVLTCAGDTMASRLGAALVVAAGLPELAVTSQGDYFSVALHLARDPARLAGLRRRLQSGRRSALLFATARRVRHLEQAFETMWQRHGRGEPPASFTVVGETAR